MLIWNDLMNSQHDNLSRGSPRLMTSDRQILYPHRQAGKRRDDTKDDQQVDVGDNVGDAVKYWV